LCGLLRDAGGHVLAEIRDLRHVPRLDRKKKRITACS
jgi:hypothetical protein